MHTGEKNKTKTRGILGNTQLLSRWESDGNVDVSEDADGAQMLSGFSVMKEIENKTSRAAGPLSRRVRL